MKFDFRQILDLPHSKHDLFKKLLIFTTYSSSFISMT